MKKLIKLIFIIILFSNSVSAKDVTTWLKEEIDIILNAYNIANISKIERFDYIENTINKNFAGAGIAKFVAGKAWSSANKEIKKSYINLFKRHLALNIASLMQGYSDQTYSLINIKEDEKNDVSMIDMEVKGKNNSVIITWRVKKSSDRFFIIDLLVADISLVVTKRSEFNSMLKKVDFNLKEFNKILLSQNELSYNKLIK